MTKRGILYIATGKGYTDMALASARSVKTLHPTMPIHLFTDQNDFNEKWIDSCSFISAPHRRSKLEYLNQSPFEETLFLDADTQVLQPIDDIFYWLKKYDIAMAHAMRRNTFATNQNWKQKIPAIYPQFNSGVILFRKNRQVKQLFAQWQKAYLENTFRLDQVCLRELCWQSDVSIGVLPPYYNIRDKKYLDFWKNQGQAVKILHLDAYKKDFGILAPKKKVQGTFFGRIQYGIGAIQWIIQQPLSWKYKLLRHD